MSTALLIVDVQEGMFMESPPPHEGGAVVERIRDLLERARRASTPIFFVQHDGGAGDLLEAGTAGFPILSELTPRAGEVVTVKCEIDAFAATDLEAKLRNAGVDRLVVCGMQTDFCVNAATRAAASRGFDVVLAADAHTTMDSPRKTAQDAIAEHNRDLAEIVTVAPAAVIGFD